MIHLLLSAALLGGGPGNPTRTTATAALQAKRFTGNRIGAVISNRGMIARDPVTFESGFEYPLGSGKHAIYAAGLWLGGSVDGELRVATGSYFYDYRGGPYGATDEDAWPVLRLTRTGLTRLLDQTPGNDASVSADERADFTRWLAYPGSPRMIDTTVGGPHFGQMVPKLTGDETLYTIYHDGGPGAVTDSTRSFGTAPLDIEIRQTVFGYNQDPSLQRVIYVRQQFFARGTRSIDSLRIGFWADPDIGDGASGGELVGYDGSRQMVFGYKSNNNDAVYGSNPPVVGWTLLQGPLVPGAAGDKGRGFGVSQTGFRNLDLSANMLGLKNAPPSAGANDPENAVEVYRLLSGLTNAGQPVDPSRPANRFAVDGDPVIGTGWIDGVTVPPADRRMMISVGPITLAPGDSQEVVTAVTVGDRGGDRIANITDLRVVADAARAQFDADARLTGVQTSSTRPDAFRLLPASPNPFNPTTTIRFQLPTTGRASLVVYDLLGRAVRRVFDESFSAGDHAVSFTADGLPSGTYLIRLASGDFSETRRITLLR